MDFLVLKSPSRCCPVLRLMGGWHSTTSGMAFSKRLMAGKDRKVIGFDAEVHP